MFLCGSFATKRWFLLCVRRLWEVGGASCECESIVYKSLITVSGLRLNFI